MKKTAKPYGDTSPYDEDEETWEAYVWRTTPGTYILGRRYHVKRLWWKDNPTWVVFDDIYDIGYLEVRNGVIEEIQIDDGYRRQGVATALFEVVQSEIGPLRFPGTIDMTPAGMEWTKSVGRVPTPGEESGSFWNPLTAATTRGLPEIAEPAVLDLNAPLDVRCTDAVFEAITGYPPERMLIDGGSVLQALSEAGFNYSTDGYIPAKTVQGLSRIPGIDRGIYYFFSSGHAMCLVNGVLTDTEGRGPDMRRIIGFYEITTQGTHTASDKGLLEGAGVSVAGSLRTDASGQYPVVRGVTIGLDGPERTDVARKIVNGTVTARDILFAVHSYDGHAGNWWGPNDGYNWGIEESRVYAYSEEHPQHYVDRFDEQNGGEIGVILVGRCEVDPAESGDGYFLDDFTRVRLDEIHYSDANGWHVLSAPSDLVAIAALDNEARISVAEHTMERKGLIGDVIQVPTGHMDDPAYQAAIQPLVQWVSDLCRTPTRFYASDYTLDREGGGAHGMVTPVGSIVVRPITNTMTILHEVAHVLNRSTHGQGHDDAYIEILAGLYRKHIGDAAADQFLGIVRPD